MPYQPAPLVARRCAHCGTEFVLPHRRRIYCSNSCNTRACLARKAAKPTAAGLAAPPTRPPQEAAAGVTLALNPQNVALLALAPQVPKAIGAILQFLGELFTPTEKGPATWLPAELRQPKQPLVAMEHASWEEPRFFVELPYAGHTLYYRAAHDLLVVREADGSLRQVRSAAEFAALRPALKTGLQALLERYTPDFVAPVQAAPVAALYPYTPLKDLPGR
ncbi:MAG: hypothetical protein EOO63_15665 [Hymenobacter sp.]|nr:MAG: hypothetical protein EOO63_15665 [Hymenobacter sp.]